MADRKPPRTVGDDRETVLTLLQYQRDSLVRKVDAVDDAVDRYRAIWARVDAVVAASSLDDRCRGLDPDEEPANLRWVLMHLLEETARHAGHADVLRELLDGSTGR